MRLPIRNVALAEIASQHTNSQFFRSLKQIETPTILKVEYQTISMVGIFVCAPSNAVWRIRPADLPEYRNWCELSGDSEIENVIKQEMRAANITRLPFGVFSLADDCDVSDFTCDWTGSKKRTP